MILLHVLALIVADSGQQAIESETSGYIRHAASSPLDAQRILDTGSSQVHLALGGENEMVVVFASFDSATESKVSYGENMSSLVPVFGTVASYSQLMEFSGQLYGPTMGAPFTTEAALLELENTSSWAYDHKTGEHFANWKNPTTLAAEGSYNNPFTIYNSPAIHTVTLSGLEAGHTYFYQVAGSERAFSFVMPGATLPMIIGLTADVGQTAVSNASITALRDMGAELVLIAGELTAIQ
jgi:hypothetical protein